MSTPRLKLKMQICKPNSIIWECKAEGRNRREILIARTQLNLLNSNNLRLKPANLNSRTYSYRSKLKKRSKSTRQRWRHWKLGSPHSPLRIKAWPELRLRWRRVTRLRSQIWCKVRHNSPRYKPNSCLMKTMKPWRNSSNKSPRRFASFSDNSMLFRQIMTNSYKRTKISYVTSNAKYIKSLISAWKH